VSCAAPQIATMRFAGIDRIPLPWPSHSWSTKSGSLLRRALLYRVVVHYLADTNKGAPGTAKAEPR
jgi:hypothetical protein